MCVGVTFFWFISSSFRLSFSLSPLNQRTSLTAPIPARLFRQQLTRGKGETPPNNNNFRHAWHNTHHTPFIHPPASPKSPINNVPEHAPVSMPSSPQEDTKNRRRYGIHPSSQSIAAAYSKNIMAMSSYGWYVSRPGTYHAINSYGFVKISLIHSFIQFKEAKKIKVSSLPIGHPFESKDSRARPKQYSKKKVGK